MINTVEERDLIKEIFRDVINEVIREERISFYPAIVPIASQAEIDDIEKLYGNPNDYKKDDSLI
jgi:hypothetical protein